MVIAMYNIGIISTIEEREYNYEEELNGINCNPSYLTIESIKSEIPSKDAYIIEDRGEGNSTSIFEIILILRGKFKGIIWVITEENKETLTSIKNLYLRLGINGVNSYKSEKESFILQLKNSLNYSGQSKLMDRGTIEQVEKLTLIPRNLSVMKGGKEIKLTRLEYQLLDLLLNNQGKSISYSEIHKKLWLRTDFSHYKIANLVFHLRKKIEDNPSKPDIIVTIRSIGYMLNLV